MRLLCDGEEPEVGLIRGWRNELFAVAVLALAAWLLGVLLGQVKPALAAAFALYLAWHLYNFIRLQSWIARRRSFRLPLSLGVWEAVFDGLQREALHNRRRKRALLASLTAFRRAADILPDALCVIDQDNQVVWHNPAAERLLGLGRSNGDRGQAITRTIRHPVLEDDLERGNSSRRSTARGRRTPGRAA